MSSQVVKRIWYISFQLFNIANYGSTDQEMHFVCAVFMDQQLGKRGVLFFLVKELRLHKKFLIAALKGIFIPRFLRTSINYFSITNRDNSLGHGVMRQH